MSPMNRPHIRDGTLTTQGDDGEFGHPCQVGTYRTTIL